MTDVENSLCTNSSSRSCGRGGKALALVRRLPLPPILSRAGPGTTAAM